MVQDNYGRFCLSYKYITKVPIYCGVSNNEHILFCSDSTSSFAPFAIHTPNYHHLPWISQISGHRRKVQWYTCRRSIVTWIRSSTKAIATNNQVSERSSFYVNYKWLWRREMEEREHRLCVDGHSTGAIHMWGKYTPPGATLQSTQKPRAMELRIYVLMSSTEWESHSGGIHLRFSKQDLSTLLSCSWLSGVSWSGVCWTQRKC